MLLSAAFLDLLVHPVFKTPLQYDATTNELFDSAHQDRFSVKEGVPILLTSSLNPSLTTTERHEHAGTQFQYKEHYQNDAVAYDYTEESENPVEKEEINRLRQNILAQIPEKAEWILDVGCGGAWLAHTLVPKERKVISMDISDINPIRAIKQVASPHNHAIVADVFEMPITQESVDCIVASEIIEHVPDPKKFLSELFKILKPGGRLIVTTPYNEFIRTSLCIHCNRLTPHNAHLHSFNEQSMKKFLPADVKNSSMKIFNSKLLVKAHVQKMLSFLPLNIYSSFESLGIALTGKKAYRLMVVLEK
ncbi:MAG TPA: class I SAM-dependent methyltransferase [Flavipsychrobacter sp.]|nr:class I SAM-dependent methyltransferase [Flavipsychrobacter sp.]